MAVRRASFSLERLQCLADFGHFLGQELQNHEVTEFGIFGLVGPHPSRPIELLQDAVMRLILPIMALGQEVQAEQKLANRGSERSGSNVESTLMLPSQAGISQSVPGILLDRRAIPGNREPQQSCPHPRPPVAASFAFRPAKPPGEGSHSARSHERAAHERFLLAVAQIQGDESPAGWRRSPTAPTTSGICENLAGGPAKALGDTFELVFYGSKYTAESMVAD